MRVILSGPVEWEDIEAADMFAGIVPTQLVSNGKEPLPDLDLFIELKPPMLFPLDPKIKGLFGELSRDYTLVQNADALIVKGRNKHLVKLAHQYNLLVYEA